MKNNIRRFLYPVFKNPIPSVKTFIHMLGFWTTGVIFTVFMQKIVKSLDLNDIDLFYDYILIFWIIFIIQQSLVIVLRSYWWTAITSTARKDLYEVYMKKYIEIDNNFIETVGTGKAIAIISKWTKTWASLIENVIMQWTNTLIWFTFVLFMIGQISFWLGWLFIILLVLGLFLWMKLNNRIVFFRNKRNKHDTLVTKNLLKILMSKFEILQSKKLNQELNILNIHEDKKIFFNERMSLPLILFFIIPEIIIFILLILVFIYFGNLYFSWNIELSLLVWISGALIYMQKVLLDSMNLFKNFTKSFSEISDFWDFFDNAPQIQWYEEWSSFAHKRWEIEIKNMNFWYVEWKNIFTDFSLKIEWEKVLALVWDSGGGKSTIAKMIAGYMKPNSGEIIIDNQKLSETSLKSYYQDVWYLTQEPSVFDGSILENLTYALDWKVLDEKISEIIIQAKCEFIYDLPNWLDTEIWERWVKLSGWQKQRLAIAKIFLKDPKIIILDEPTSALDSFSEEQITKAMQNLFENRTVIVVAHRLQTVKHAHRILVLQDGKIVEDGNHDNLVKEQWKYAKMLELQSGF